MHVGAGPPDCAARCGRIHKKEHRDDRGGVSYPAAVVKVKGETLSGIGFRILSGHARPLLFADGRAGIQCGSVAGIQCGSVDETLLRGVVSVDTIMNACC